MGPGVTTPGLGSGVFPKGCFMPEPRHHPASAAQPATGHEHVPTMGHESLTPSQLRTAPCWHPELTPTPSTTKLSPPRASPALVGCFGKAKPDSFQTFPSTQPSHGDECFGVASPLCPTGASRPALTTPHGGMRERPAPRELALSSPPGTRFWIAYSIYLLPGFCWGLTPAWWSR